MNAEIKEKIERIFDMCESSFIYKEDELILHKKWNIYFRLPEIKSVEEFDYKVLSCLSYYTATHHYKKTEAQSKWAYRLLCRWFKKDFDYDDLQKIYQRFGGRANPKLGILFIQKNFDMSILNEVIK